MRLCAVRRLVENFGSGYAKLGDRIGSEERGDRNKGDIIADITTSFVVLMGIFFPSVTGTTPDARRQTDKYRDITSSQNLFDERLHASQGRILMCCVEVDKPTGRRCRI